MQSSLRLCLTAFLVMLVGGGNLLGSPATPLFIKAKQPDGSLLELRLRGDEFYHWMEDADGHTVVKTANGTYAYAEKTADGTLKPSALIVGRDLPTKADLPKHLMPALEVRNLRRQRMADADMKVSSAAGTQPNRINPTGTVRNLVVLCRFSNHTAAHGRTQAEYDTIFNTIGGDATLAPTGSVRDYFTEVSYGALTLQSTVVAWVTLPQTEAYYGAGEDGLGTYPQNAQRMVEDALNLTDPLVNFAQFDQDNDGFIDAITVIHSGYGAETGGGSGNWVWSHKWSLPTTWTSSENNGVGVRVKVRDYHTEPALWGTSGTDPLRIGVICHETGHFFGLPDLYDTNDGGEGIGSYCLMANSWGFDFTQLHPPHFSAWCRIQLGWVTPTVVSTGTISVPRVETTSTVYKITAGYPSGEYLLVENRQPYGFESILPQGGLCVWHIDEAKSSNQDEGYPGQAGWPGNNRHYKIALLQADGAYHMERGANRGDAGDVYRAGGVAAVSDSTVPSLNRYQSGVVAPSGNRLEAISAPSATMTFTLNPAPTQPPVITSALTANANTSANLTYQITATNYPTSFSAVGLPAGLSLVSSTGEISGTPSVLGTFNIQIGATNALGTGTAILVMNVADLASALAEALDVPGRVITSSGNVPWFPQGDTTYDGVDAAQAGSILDNQSSSMGVTVTGPVNITFWTKVSSEAGWDFLRFAVDGVEQLSLSGESDWTLRSFAAASGAHTLTWNYAKDDSVSSGADTAWVDALVISGISAPPEILSVSTATGFASVPFSYQIIASNAPTSWGASGLPVWLTVNTSSGLISGTPPATGVFNFTVSATNSFGTATKGVQLTVSDPNAALPDALDVTELTFNSASTTGWNRQVLVTYDGSDAAESGVIGHSQSSRMETTVAGPGTVSFFWRVSSEANYDYLRFYADGVQVGQISGEQDWAIFSHAIAAGAHVLRWEYAKDSSVTNGLDRAWVDSLEAGPPVITSPLAATGRVGDSFVYQLAASGNPTSFNATGLPAGLVLHSATGVIDGIPTSVGVFNVSLAVTNSFGSGTATLVLAIDPELVGRRTLVAWDHPWQCFHPMGTLPPALGNFDAAWFLAQAAFDSTYTGPPFGNVPATYGTPSVTDTFDSFSGPGPFGYGDIDYFNGGEFTGFGSILSQPDLGNRRAAYFRTTFEVTGGALVRPILRYLFDDGGFIYLDGQLICAVNMPIGVTDVYDLNAAGVTNTENFVWTVDPTVSGAVPGGNATVTQAVTSLTPGTHTLAVSVRSNLPSSSDLGMALELTAESAPAEPELTVLGGPAGNVVISNGDTSPSLPDRTDFGSRFIPDGPLDVNFVIANAGSLALSLGNVSVSGEQFSILPGYGSLIPAGSSTTLTVRFSPIAGAYQGTVSIPSDDADENPFTFDIAAFGTTTGLRQTLVPWNHSWKYYHPMGALPASPGNFNTFWFAAESVFASTYTGPTFGAVPSVAGVPSVSTSYDSGMGLGSIGYGSVDYWSSAGAEFIGHGSVLTQPLAGNRRTGYFRTTFTVPAGGLVRPRLRYIMDDGGFLYLDGNLICTVNMADGVADTYAQSAANVDGTEAFIRTGDLWTAGAVLGGNAFVNSPVTFLSAGVHTLAVSVHNAASSSSDLELALELSAEAGCAIAATATDVVRIGGNTPSPLDDKLSFVVTAVGSNASASWTCATPLANGIYGVPVSFSNISITNAAIPLTLILQDSADASCTTLLSIPIPPLVGLNEITGEPIFLEDRTLGSGAAYNETAPAMQMNNARTATASQLISLATVSGDALLSFDLGAVDASTGSNFEGVDYIRALLILNPGATQTVLDLLHRWDADRNGILNGYTSVTGALYDNMPWLDEFNLNQALSTGTFSSSYHIETTIPDTVSSAQLVLDMANDSNTETFTLANLRLSALPNPDTDGDGLDDAWERTWFGNLTAQSGGEDADNDGATNAEECLAGTRPNDRASRLTFQTHVRNGNTYTLEIRTVPGRRYRLETNASLSPAGWSPVGAAFSATSDVTIRTVTMNSSTPRVFLRASIVAP